MSVVPRRFHLRFPNPQHLTTLQQGPPVPSFFRGEMPELTPCISHVFFRELQAELGGKPMSHHPFSSSPHCFHADAFQWLICCDIHLHKQRRNTLKVSPQVRQDARTGIRCVYNMLLVLSLSTLWHGPGMPRCWHRSLVPGPAWVAQDLGLTTTHSALGSQTPQDKFLMYLLKPPEVPICTTEP